MQCSTWTKLMMVAALALGCSALAGCSSDIEGDAPGECSDGADNDRDGAFDCDDSDCAGSPDCKEQGQDGGGDAGPDGGLLAWQQIASGGVHNCGITADGELMCWGNDAQGQSSPPSGTFSETRVSFYHSCGLDSGGALSCWGCKGDQDYGQCEVPTSLTDVAYFDAGTYATCVAAASGVVSCWGCNSADHGQCEPPAGSFEELAAGSLHVCGLEEGTATCWGNDDYGQSTPPGSVYSQLSAGTWHTCGLRSNATIECWGCDAPAPDKPADFGQCDTPSGSFQQVAVGVYHSCGLKNDGSVVCWGCIGSHNDNETDTGQCDPPDESFEAIGVGKYHGCGLGSDGSVSCWGNDYYGQLVAP